MTDERVVIRTPSIPLTPGHFLRASIVALPSGATQAGTVDGVGNYPVQGVFGQVKVAVSYNNGATTTVTETIDLPGSKLENGAQPTGPGAAWANLITRLTSHILPADMSIPANLAAWSDGVSVSVVVSYVGSPRVIDLCIWEEPYALAVDSSTSNWPAPMHGNATGGPAGTLPGKVPLIKRTGSDSGGGAEIVCDAAARACQELGPVLFYATAWDEDAQSVASTETDYRAVTTAVSPAELISLTGINPSAGNQGWSVSSGANAARIQDTLRPRAYRGYSQIIPVRLCVYGAMSVGTGPTCTIRLEWTGAPSPFQEYVELLIPTGTTYQWHETVGYIRVGMGAQDPHVMQIRATLTNISGSPEFRWRYLAVLFAPGC